MSILFKKKPKLLVFVVCFFLTGTTLLFTQFDCCAFQVAAKPNPSDSFIVQSEVDEIVAILEKSPLWTRLSDKGLEADAILAAMEKVSQYDVKIIRNAIEKYLKNNSQNLYAIVGVESRIFILNRYLFKVPESDKFENGTFGGWANVPVKEREINWLWPLAYKPDGQLYIQGRFAGYFGHPYLAITEFDYFYKTYGLRK